MGSLALALALVTSTPVLTSTPAIPPASIAAPEHWEVFPATNPGWEYLGRFDPARGKFIYSEARTLARRPAQPVKNYGVSLGPNLVTAGAPMVLTGTSTGHDAQLARDLVADHASVCAGEDCDDGTCPNRRPRPRPKPDPDKDKKPKPKPEPDTFDWRKYLPEGVEPGPAILAVVAIVGILGLIAFVFLVGFLVVLARILRFALSDSPAPDAHPEPQAEPLP